MAKKFFRPCWKQILCAQKIINFETYIFWSEAIGKELVEAFTDRSRMPASRYTC